MLSGVPQGSVLGPVLFLIFISDLPDNIRYSVRLFPDDCVLYRNIHSRQDCLTLQEDLTSLGQWEADWQMKFNIAKSSFQCYSVLSDILVKNELCIPLERGSNVLSTGEGFIGLSPPSKLKITVRFCSIYKKKQFRSVL